jgi:hypothetical protein
MEHESMVHALEEMHRVLTPRGLLIDLRPLEEHWPVEVSSGSTFIQTGSLNAMEDYAADDEAASGAMREVEARGLFVREQESSFPYYYSWDRPSEMKEFIETEWERVDKLDEGVFRAAQSAWASGGAEARVRVRVRMLITGWRRSP